MPIVHSVHFKNNISLYYSDWTATGTRNQLIDFDLESSPLQIQTDSVVGSRDLIWVRFLQQQNGGGLSVWFEDPPRYNLGYCTDMISSERKSFSMPGVEKHRVWTVRKRNNQLQLLCNGVEIFNFNFAESSSSVCRSKWSLDFTHIQFARGETQVDTASDYFRQLTKSKPFSPISEDS